MAGLVGKIKQAIVMNGIPASLLPTMPPGLGCVSISRHLFIASFNICYRANIADDAKILFPNGVPSVFCASFRPKQNFLRPNPQEDNAIGAARTYAYGALVRAKPFQELVLKANDTLKLRHPSQGHAPDPR